MTSANTALNGLCENILPLRLFLPKHLCKHLSHLQPCFLPRVNERQTVDSHLVKRWERLQVYLRVFQHVVEPLSTVHYFVTRLLKRAPCRGLPVHSVPEIAPGCFAKTTVPWIIQPPPGTSTGASNSMQQTPRFRQILGKHRCLV